jgi:hypothetical protein
MKTTHEPLHRHTYMFYLYLLFCLIKYLNMVMVQNFDVMLGQTLNHCAEFCNFVQRHILVKCLLATSC